MSGKRKKPTIPKQVRKLEIQAERLFKEICFLRDGNQCMVKKLHPTISITHAGPLQVDHCITRKNKWFFYEPRNGTVVCGACNRAKYYKQKSVDRAIDNIVMDREGDWFDEAVIVDQSMRPNHGWKKVWWLEQIVAELEVTLANQQKKGSNGDKPSLPPFLFD